MVVAGDFIALMGNCDDEALAGEIHELKQQIQALATSVGAPGTS